MQQEFLRQMTPGILRKGERISIKVVFSSYFTLNNKAEYRKNKVPAPGETCQAGIHLASPHAISAVNHP